MALQNRRGLEADFDPSKMLPGEWAVSLDTKYVRMCFSPGVVMRMATYESFEEDMLQIQQILATCEDIQTAVEAFEELAQQHANDAAASATASANSAILSDSWAEGGTGTRPGEDTNNAKYWAGVAQAVADIHIATNETVGIVKGNEGEINIDIGGQMSIPSDFSPQTTLEAVTGTEDKKTFFGKVAKVITDFIAHAANLSIHFGLTNNLLATVEGTALDAVQGKSLDDKITDLNSNLAVAKTDVPNAYVDYKIIGNKYSFTFVINASLKTNLSSGTAYTIGNLGHTLINAYNKRIWLADGYEAWLGISTAGAISLKPMTNIINGAWLMCTETFVR